MSKITQTINFDKNIFCNYPHSFCLNLYKCTKSMVMCDYDFVNNETQRIFEGYK